MPTKARPNSLPLLAILSHFTQPNNNTNSLEDQDPSTCKGLPEEPATAPSLAPYWATQATACQPIHHHRVRSAGSPTAEALNSARVHLASHQGLTLTSIEHNRTCKRRQRATRLCHPCTRQYRQAWAASNNITRVHTINLDHEEAPLPKALAINLYLSKATFLLPHKGQ